MPFTSLSAHRKGFIAILALASAVAACDATPLRAPGEGTPSGAASAAAPPPTTVSVARFRVEGLTCEGCAMAIRESLEPVPGVVNVLTSVREKRVTVQFDSTRINAAAVAAAVNKTGYSGVPEP